MVHSEVPCNNYSYSNCIKIITSHYSAVRYIHSMLYHMIYPYLLHCQLVGYMPHACIHPMHLYNSHYLVLCTSLVYVSVFQFHTVHMMMKLNFPLGIQDLLCGGVELAVELAE